MNESEEKKVCPKIMQSTKPNYTYAAPNENYDATKHHHAEELKSGKFSKSRRNGDEPNFSS